MAEDHEKLGNDLEREANELEKKNQAVDRHIEETRADWERKRADEAVPGAVPRSDEEEAALGVGGAGGGDPEDVPAGGP